MGVLNLIPLSSKGDYILNICLKKSPPLLTEQQTKPSGISAYVVGTIDGTVLGNYRGNKTFYGASMEKPILALMNAIYYTNIKYHTITTKKDDESHEAHVKRDNKVFAMAKRLQHGWITCPEQLTGAPPICSELILDEKIFYQEAKNHLLTDEELDGLLGYRGLNSNAVNRSIKGTNPGVKWSTADKRYTNSRNGRCTPKPCGKPPLAVPISAMKQILQDIDPNGLLKGIRFANGRQTALSMYNFMMFLLNAETIPALKDYNPQVKRILNYMTRSVFGDTYPGGYDRDSAGIIKLKKELNRYWPNKITSIWGKGGFTQKTPVLNYALVINNQYILVVYTRQPIMNTACKPQQYRCAKNAAFPPLTNAIVQALSSAEVFGAPTTQVKKKATFIDISKSEEVPENISFFPGTKNACGTAAMQRYVMIVLGTNLQNYEWCVGDISKCPTGGPIAGHDSHKIGIDIDVALPTESRGLTGCSTNQKEGKWIKKGGQKFKNITPEQLDATAAFNFLKATAPWAQYVGVDKQFWPKIKEAAEKAGMVKDSAAYKRTFSVLRAWKHHKSHFHVRLGTNTVIRVAPTKAGGATTVTATAQPSISSEIEKIGQEKGAAVVRCNQWKVEEYKDANNNACVKGTAGCKKRGQPAPGFEYDPDFSFADFYCDLELWAPWIDKNLKSAEDILKKYDATLNWIYDGGHDKAADVLQKAWLQAEIADKLSQQREEEIDFMGPEWQKLLQQLKNKPGVSYPTPINCGGRDALCGKNQTCEEWPGKKRWRCVYKKKEVKENMLPKSINKTIHLSIQKTNYKKYLLEKKPVKAEKIKINKNLLQESIKQKLLNNPQLLDRLALNEGPVRWLREFVAIFRGMFPKMAPRGKGTWEFVKRASKRSANVMGGSWKLTKHMRHTLFNKYEGLATGIWMTSMFLDDEGDQPLTQIFNALYSNFTMSGQLIYIFQRYGMKNRSQQFIYWTQGRPERWEKMGKKQYLMLPRNRYKGAVECEEDAEGNLVDTNCWASDDFCGDLEKKYQGAKSCGPSYSGHTSGLGTSYWTFMNPFLFAQNVKQYLKATDTLPEDKKKEIIDSFDAAMSATRNFESQCGKMYPEDEKGQKVCLLLGKKMLAANTAMTLIWDKYLGALQTPEGSPYSPTSPFIHSPEAQEKSREVKEKQNVAMQLQYGYFVLSKCEYYVKNGPPGGAPDPVYDCKNLSPNYKRCASECPQKHTMVGGRPGDLLELGSSPMNGPGFKYWFQKYVNDPKNNFGGITAYEAMCMLVNTGNTKGCKSPGVDPELWPLTARLCGICPQLKKGQRASAHEYVYGPPGWISPATKKTLPARPTAPLTSDEPEEFQPEEEY